MDEILKYVDVLVKITIPITIFLATRRIARAQYTNTANTGWNEFNKIAISNDDNVALVLEHMHPPDFAKGNKTLLRKAYLGFIYLNAANTFFIGLQSGLVDSKHNDAQFSHLVGPLLLDEHFYQMSQGRGYHPKFSDACKRARERAIASIRPIGSGSAAGLTTSDVSVGTTTTKDLTPSQGTGSRSRTRRMRS